MVFLETISYIYSKFSSCVIEIIIPGLHPRLWFDITSFFDLIRILLFLRCRSVGCICTNFLSVFLF